MCIKFVETGIFLPAFKIILRACFMLTKTIMNYFVYLQKKHKKLLNIKNKV